MNSYSKNMRMRVIESVACLKGAGAPNVSRLATACWHNQANEPCK